MDRLTVFVGRLAVLVAGALAIAPWSRAADGDWRLPLAENAELPPMFRQLAIPRADGSTQTAYLGNFDDSLATRKPLLVYLGGSGAQSIFVRVEGKIGFSMEGLVARTAADRFHVVLPEKRGVGFAEHVERPGSAVGATEEYQLHATLEARVADVRRLIDTLVKQPLVDADRILVMGHSEGADVAAAVAAADGRVTHVACLSGAGGPQFYDFFVLRRRQLTEQGADAEQIEQAMTALQDEIRAVLAKPDSTTDFWLGHAHRRWSSFATHASADDLVSCRAKVFLAQGSADQAVPIESFDYTVTRLLTGGKPDARIVRYPGRDHSLMRPGETGGYDGMLEVFEEALAWALAD